MSGYERRAALAPGDRCEFRYPARREWQPGTVVKNGGAYYWSVRDEGDSEGKRGVVTTSLYIEHVRAQADTTGEQISACHICGEPIDYCLGHSEAERIANPHPEDGL